MSTNLQVTAEGNLQHRPPDAQSEFLAVPNHGQIESSSPSSNNSTATSVSGEPKKPITILTTNPGSVSPVRRGKRRRPRQKRPHFKTYKGIHLRAPIYMVGLFFVGFIASLGHHLYYMSLHGDQVGTESQQQWSLRFGTAFAYITQIALVASVGVAYTQWLWRTISRTHISIETLDDGFDADTAIISLLNTELLRKVTVGAILALICWCLQLPSLVTPATLSVLPTLRTTQEVGETRTLDMYGNSVYGSNQTKRFTNTVNATDSKKVLFLGPRTVISRLTTATATQGEILPIQHPYPNATYLLDFFGPAIKCDPANETVIDYIEKIRGDAKKNDPNLIANYYHSFVPKFADNDSLSPSPGEIQAFSAPRMQQQNAASNELWMVYSSYIAGQRNTFEDRYTACKLYNASYHLNFTFEETKQSVKSTNIEFINVVDYPRADAEYSNATMIQHAYSSVMWAISDLLVGTMGTFATNDSADYGKRLQYSEIKTEISHTSLLGSKDLRVFFDKNRQLVTNNMTASDQTLEDINLAGNNTLDYLIEQLGFNVTMSFLNSRLLSPPTNKTIQVTRSLNTYSYSARNLFLSYGLALLFALAGNALGAYAFWTNKASHSRTFSARYLATKDKGVLGVIREEKSVRLPLSDRLREMEVRFCVEEWGFMMVGDPLGGGKEREGGK